MRFLLSALLGATAATVPGFAQAPATAPADPAVVVDFSVRSGAYQVVGDVSLLSQRYSPGSTFEMIIAAVALEAGEISGDTAIPPRSGGSSDGENPWTLPRALRESHSDFFAQLLKRTGYDPVRKFLVESRYTPGIPEAIASFAELARGEPLRVTVFEQNLFIQAFRKRDLPLQAEHCAALERWMALESPRSAWGKEGTGEVTGEPPRFVSWFNGVAPLRDGPHVITVAVLTPRRESVALSRFREYLAARRSPAS